MKQALVPLKKRVYDLSGPVAQYLYGRVQFALGQRPTVNPASPAVHWPKPYRAYIVISADFELAWAWRYIKDSANAYAVALQKAEQTRQNLPILLDLFDRFNVPITWATVGHLFLENCARQNGRPHPDILRPPYLENEYWRYTSGDWFDDDPCSDYRHSPAWYAPDLLQSIQSAKVKHEIACHTYSHIDCSDGNCPPEVMDAEMAECQRLATEWEITLKSFVFPGNLPGNFTSLKKHGLTAYRWHNGYELDMPRQDSLGLWQIPGGVCWERPEGWPVEAWIGALRRCVDRALETGTVLHLWFHPSCDKINVERVFPAVLDYVALHRFDLCVTTMAGLVDSFTSTGQ